MENIEPALELHSRARQALNENQASQETTCFGIVTVLGGIAVGSASEIAAIPIIVIGAGLVLKGVYGIMKNRSIEGQQHQKIDDYKEFKQIMTTNGFD
jgi:hypothetical protein